MLIEELLIRDFVLIEEARLELGPGVNVFSGETGAGKSVLMDALRYVFGGGPSGADYLRAGASSLEVAARLSLNGESDGRWTQFLEETGAQMEDSAILVRRLFDSRTQKSKAFLGDAPVSAATLRKAAVLALEFHGQGASASLLGADQPRILLDAWAGFEEDLEKFRAAYQHWRQALTRLQEHESWINENKRRADFLEFERQELEAACSDEEKIFQIENKLPLWLERENLAAQLKEIEAAISGAQVNAQALIGQAVRAAQRLETASGTPALAQGLRQMLDQSQELLSEVSRRCLELEGTLEADSSTVEELLNLKAKLDRLLTKHQYQDYGQLRLRLEVTREEILRLGNAEHDGTLLQKEQEKRRQDCEQLARELSRRRKSAAVKLGNGVEREIQNLGMAQAKFEVQVASAPALSESGLDEVAFWLTPNPGEGRYRADQIASGGETSRLALALRKLLAASPGKGRCPVLIFDEIEQGLSAKAAALSADYLKEIGSANQVLVVTHSPLLAAAASSHFVLTKKVRQGRTLAGAERLNSYQQRHEEILRLLGAANGEERRVLEPYVEKLLKVTSGEKIKVRA